MAPEKPPRVRKISTVVQMLISRAYCQLNLSEHTVAHLEIQGPHPLGQRMPNGCPLLALLRLSAAKASVKHFDQCTPHGWPQALLYSYASRCIHEVLLHQQCIHRGHIKRP
eukprot:scaffold19570_cov18-Tisochrysis_lutea.AAC.2